MSPTSLSANIVVGTGISAKLACSGRYLSGFDEAQIRDDLASTAQPPTGFPLLLTMQKVELRQICWGFREPRPLFGRG